MPASTDPPEPTPDEVFRDDLAGWPECAARQHRRGDWGGPDAYQLAIAASLDSFVAYLRSRPPSDARLRELARLSLPNSSYVPSDMAYAAMRDYHVDHLSPAAFLERLVRIAWHEHERSTTAPPADTDQPDTTQTHHPEP